MKEIKLKECIIRKMNNITVYVFKKYFKVLDFKYKYKSFNFIIIILDKYIF